MRVIAGQYRHRRLIAPPGVETRPILDRVKVSLFDWLGSRLAMPGRLPAVRVLDLFSGGGSLGIEALSRGASSCTFVECGKEALAALRRNLDELTIGPEAVICAGRAESARIASPGGHGFELIFFDPPYRLTDAYPNDGVLDGVLSRLGQDIDVARGALLLWRHAVGASVPTSFCDRWSNVECRAWGEMAITMYERREPVTA
jgi:16S rRNA (guanine966-N2)-methyltransferase